MFFSDSAVLKDHWSNIFWSRHTRSFTKQQIGGQIRDGQPQRQQHQQSAANELHGIRLVSHLWRGQTTSNGHRVLVQVCNSVLSRSLWGSRKPIFSCTPICKPMRRARVVIWKYVVSIRCMDLDGDGYLSMYELEYFYEEQLQRMESLGIETLPFEDCLCQVGSATSLLLQQSSLCCVNIFLKMLDMIHPTVPGKVSLNDLKRCQMTPIFFDTFFNLEKYLDHEQRDPFASQRDPDSENGDEIVKVCRYHHDLWWRWLMLNELHRYRTGTVTLRKSTSCWWRKKAALTTMTTCRCPLNGL